MTDTCLFFADTLGSLVPLFAHAEAVESGTASIDADLSIRLALCDLGAIK